MSEIERRKTEHIDLVMAGDVSQATHGTGLDGVRFEHNALPEMCLADVNLESVFLGRNVSAPILVSSMTGGAERSASLNRSIAEACGALQLGFGVGSQRIALEGGNPCGFSGDLRRAAPDVPILANFGAAQLNVWDGVDMAHRAVDMIEADALIIHLNPLQEAVQNGGDTNWSGLLNKIETLCKKCTFPIIVKEVGAGLSANVASNLTAAGVAGIDVAGLGGTSWAAVEGARAPNQLQCEIAEAFRDWGIPTAQAIMSVREACPDALLIGSGGIRNGLDCARAIRLGADMVGIAAGVLPNALEGTGAIRDKLIATIEQLRIACFCTASQNLDELRAAPLIAAPQRVRGARS
ncbi:MAG: type 2 isopentenyl-diphosphate Delta-isomerase [Hyphomicrobiaceae bacterium]